MLCGGNADNNTSSGPSLHVTALHVSAESSDEILRRFWEIEEPRLMNSPVLSLEERSVVEHFMSNHSRSQAGRFMVPLPRKPGAGSIGESRSQAVRRFLTHLNALLAAKASSRTLMQSCRNTLILVMRSPCLQKIWT